MHLKSDAQICIRNPSIFSFINGKFHIILFNARIKVCLVLYHYRLTMASVNDSNEYHLRLNEFLRMVVFRSSKYELAKHFYNGSTCPHFCWRSIANELLTLITIYTTVVTTDFMLAMIKIFQF